jgi:DNA-binding XRE family transcriptional regulator|tara:strand:+ start:223 stop:642 length:420 start_codon:yes stop_codon:yes gene_type:complete
MTVRPYKSNTKTEQDIKINKAIGKKIKEARLNRVVYITVPEVPFITSGHTIKKQKPCTQTELSKAIGVTFQQIQKYEKGTNGLSIIRLLQISNFFNEPLEYFTSDVTELLGQHNPPSNNFKSIAPSNDSDEVNLKSDYN